MKKRFALDTKMYIFVAATVLFAAFGVCALSYVINSNQIDEYYKHLSSDCANTYARYVDVSYVSHLRSVVESDEYQAVRDTAEENDDDSLVVDYLKEKGLWYKYNIERDRMIDYQQSMTDVRYLYLIAYMGVEADHDMYLIDADDVPFYETGYYELREEEFGDQDLAGGIEPVISNGDWGYLCSAYAPVYDENGELVCIVGCDIAMEEVMSERLSNLTYTILGALFCTCIVLVGAIVFIRRTVVRPLDLITNDMKRFDPSSGKGYKEAGVIDLDIRTNDEIRDIYEEIRSMQTRITDYINDITVITRDKKIAEDAAKRDGLTGVGNKASYLLKEEELDTLIAEGKAEFAIVMVDINRLKYINDKHGHSNGDTYIKGCCHIVCDIFSHSPVFRIGGDEFVAVLTGKDYEERTGKMDQLRTVFEEAYGNDKLDPWFRYSASAGMAEYSSGDDSAAAVFKRADALMYEAKNGFKERNGFKES